MAVWTRSRTGSRDGIDENRGRKYPISCLIRVADKLLPSLSPPLTARAMCDETGARSREGRDDDGKPVALVSDPGDPRTAFTECCRRDERRRTQTPPNRTDEQARRDAYPTTTDEPYHLTRVGTPVRIGRRRRTRRRRQDGNDGTTTERTGTDGHGADGTQRHGTVGNLLSRGRPGERIARRSARNADNDGSFGHHEKAGDDDES